MSRGPVSLRSAIRFAREGDYDAFIAVGGGSTIDTAKAANLYSCWPADFLDYVNPPIGKGKPVPGPVKPLIAIPTTAGTGAEVTRNAVLSSPQHRLKASLRSPHMLPRLAVVDPELTLDLPPALTAGTGLGASVRPRAYARPSKRCAWTASGSSWRCRRPI